MVTDTGPVDALELPACAAQAQTQFEFLEGMEIAIRQIIHLPDRIGAVKSAAAKMADVAGLLRLLLQMTFAILDAQDSRILDYAADACDIVFGSQVRQGRLDEPGVKLHVAVQQVDELSPRVLETQLRPAAAAAIGGTHELSDGDWKAPGDLHRPVIGKRVGEDDLAAHVGDRAQGAFNRLGDLGLFVQRLDDHAYASHGSAPVLAGGDEVA